MLPQRDFLIERLKSSRRQLDELVDFAPTDKFIYPNWTIKQYLDHLSGWDDAVVAALKAHAKGELVPQIATRGINFYNAQTVSTRESIDLDHSKQEYESSRHEVIQALHDLPDEKFNQPLVFPWGETGTVAYFIEIFVEHDEHHTHHLTTWLKQPDKALEVE